MEKRKYIDRINTIAFNLAHKAEGIDMNYANDIDIAKITPGTEFIALGGAQNVQVRCLEADTENGAIVMDVKYQGESWIDKHFHNYQTEVIKIEEGEIFDEVTNLKKGAGDVYFINKKELHHIKSTKGARLTILFCTKYHTIGEFLEKNYAVNEL